MKHRHLQTVLFLCAAVSVHGQATEGDAEGHPLGPGETLPDGWYQSDWMGAVHTEEYPWIYKPGSGWLFHFRPEGGNGHWWLDDDLGWIFTRENWYPSLYRLDSGSWLRHVPGTASPGWYYDFALDQYWEEGREPSPRHIEAYAALSDAVRRVKATAGSLSAANRYPIHTEVGGHDWVEVASRDWTAGFWPGILWMIYDFNGETVLRRLAERAQQGMAGERFRTNTHDLGFMIFNSFGKAHTLGYGDHEEIITDAARSLTQRFDADVGAIRSWSWGEWDDGNRLTVIVDNLLNLELLMWASKQPSGDPAWRDMAVQHADTTMEHFFREDGSTYHVVIFDENTGEVIRKTTHQGYDDHSIWARGQAWALYGYSMMYRETGYARYLEQAIISAEAFISNLPEDAIPYWDFRSPFIPDDVRDSSAAAIAASALVELSQLVEDASREKRYHEAAATMLDGLMSDPYFRENSTSALIGHGTYNWKNGNKDTGTTWGDYYFLEALRRFLDRGGYLKGEGSSL
ncbi:MAG: glycoside hydrolase family 88 protein [Oceanipulchritudo sp.]